MSIVKLLLVPLWPFFITNFLMKKYNNGEFNLKGYVSTVFFLYCFMIFGIWEIAVKFFDKNSSAEAETTAPSAEVAQ